MVRYCHYSCVLWVFLPPLDTRFSNPGFLFLDKWLDEFRQRKLGNRSIRYQLHAFCPLPIRLSQCPALETCITDTADKNGFQDRVRWNRSCEVCYRRLLKPHACFSLTISLAPSYDELPARNWVERAWNWLVRSQHYLLLIGSCYKRNDLLYLLQMWHCQGSCRDRGSNGAKHSGFPIVGVSPVVFVFRDPNCPRDLLLEINSSHGR